MWYTILIMLVVDFGGLLLLYVVLSNRVKKATTVQSQIDEIREEVSRLLVELNQTTDRNVAVLEDKIASLNEVLSSADKKIGLLQREIEKHDVGSQIYSRLAERKPQRPPEAVPAPAVPPEPAQKTAPRSVPPRVEKAPALAVELSEKPDLHERVMMLHRSGFAPSLIASRVGVPLGEIELIISLEQRKGKA